MKPDSLRVMGWLIVACGLVLALGLVLWSALSPLGQKEFPAIIRIDNHVGFDVDPNELDFGTLRPGDTGKKEIQVTNNFRTAALIQIRASESIRELVSIPENGFWLLPGENRVVPILVQIPRENRFEMRVGTILILFYRA